MDDLTRLDYAAWTHDWLALTDSPPPFAVHAALMAAYAQPHRAYHNAEHIADCLRQLDALLRAGCPCEHPSEVAVALWYHDAIYAPLASDNEAQSAQWLDRVAHEAGTSMAVRDRLRA
jgi:predicted metal-dependent HD superfamily phosphohydrolase